jgi:hypothetical protein
MKKIGWLFLIIPLLSFSQIQGIILDANTKKPLPFASVLTNTNNGTLSDVDGKFTLKTNQPINQLTITYVGYNTAKIPVNETDKFFTIKLTPSVENLNEILITATENPALQIIRNAIANKPNNNIEKSLNTFQFNTYNKILVTANPDSINGKLDSLFVIKNGEKKFEKIDSTNFKFKKELEKQHLYISEKISEFKFEKGKKTKEVILASRMAGLKQPIYELFAITFQDFSFYNEFYTIAGTKYTNPIANNAIKHYNYKILDTVQNEHGSSYIIYFKPLKNKEYLGIEGVLYIDTQNFAITKAIAELKGVVNVKASQHYTYLNTFNNWFPTNKYIEIKKGNSTENIALFGGVVKFTQNEKIDTIQNTATNKPEDIIYFISTSENSNIKINTPVEVVRASSTIQFNDDATNKSEEFWNAFRTDSLGLRGENTYKYIDSIAEEEGIEKKINLARNLLKGYYPTKYVNLDLGKILNLNNHEGFRVGFGGQTNANFSQKFKIEAYGAYGTKDTNFKYSVGGAVRLNKDTNTWFGLKYTDDIVESASFHFIAENTSFSPINPRNLNISQFYNYKTGNVFLAHNLQPNLEAKLMFSAGDYKNLFDYKYISPTRDLTEYTLTTLILGLNYTPNSEYMNSPLGKITVKTGYPQFTLQLTQSFDDIFDSDFGFTQLNLRISHKIQRLRKSTTSFLIEGGIVFGETPISHLYNSTPNYTYKNPWFKRVTFAGTNSFETMGYNEFISDRFSAIHIKHQFRFFNIGKKFKPQLTIATRAAIGNIQHPEYQTGITFSKMNNGYFESGLEFNSLFKGLGLSAFYRYGTYSNPVWSDNLAVKITYNFRLGF